jgi:hypothetical protein
MIISHESRLRDLRKIKPPNHQGIPMYHPHIIVAQESTAAAASSFKPRIFIFPPLVNGPPW